MKRLMSPDGRLGLVCILLALFALIVWVPQDIETGLLEKMRRQVRIGDTMLPVLALSFVIGGGLMTLVSQRPDAPSVTRQNLLFCLKLVLVLTCAIALMRWVGPMIVAIAGEDASYRALRDTVPWKYFGFVVGGTALVAGLMTLAEGRVTGRALITGLFTTLILIVLYDLPFEDLLLPPNGDV